jgi:hypothetical protein
MSPSNALAEAIGGTVRSLAMIAIWMVLVAGVAMAIVIGLRALGGRQAAGLRDQTADREAVARAALTRHTVTTGSWTPPAVAYPSIGPHADDSAPDSPRVPVHSGH